jgi:methionine--tRNA ligase beta chain
MMTIDDFKKIELKVGRVLNAEPIEGSEKLLKLQVDLGESDLPAGRQVLAGIAKHYQPTDLVGKQIVIIANLEPRSMMGLESNGMVLAAGDDEIVSLLAPDKDVPTGSTVR